MCIRDRGNRWGTFYAFGLGWDVSKENFMEDANWLDQLKLRGTFGKTGNGMDNSGYYGYRQTFSSNVAAGYPMGINSVSYTHLDAVHAALKTATELDMEIGMFNSPGWSQSGGPWVKPEQSMRYLAATDTMVKGPRTLSYTIPEYSDSMQLVRVIRCV